MDAMQMLAERLRPLVNMKSWDYCVVWRLDKDHRFINLVGCCCGGVVENKDGEDQELLFPVSPVLPACRDFISQHPRTRNCHLLARLPPSIALDSGDHAQTLISNLPGWKNLPDCSSSDSSISTLENVGTRVLIPVVTGVLVELFVTKQVCEDPSIIEFVMAQSINLSWEQEAMNTQSNTDMLGGQEQVESSPVVDHGLGTVDVNGIIDEDDDDQYQPNKLFPNNAFTLKDNSNNNYSWMSHSPAPDNLNLPWDLSFDQIRPGTATSPFMTFCSGYEQQEIQTRNVDIALEGSPDSIISDRQTLPLNSSKNHRLHHHHGYPDEVITSNLPLMSTTNAATTNITTAGDHRVLHPSMESTVTKETGGHDDQKDPIKQEMGRADSVSDCSDQIEDDDDHKVVGRSGRRHQSKNLVAERNRRKKLNDRLYALRALVPKITKMDRASILGDAIEFVKELQKQVKELQDELEEPPLAPEDGDKNSTGKIFDITSSTSAQLDPIQNDPNGVCFGTNSKSETRKESLNGLKMGRGCCSRLKQLPQDYAITDDKQQQMEVQVDVTQVNGNEFFLKVFCEYKPSGFVRLMEAMNSLGFEVTNANVTTFRGLVLNVFKVEKRDNEIVQAEHVRESLLELTRNPIPVGGVGGGWSVSERENRSDYHHQQHRNHNYVNSHHHHHLHSLHQIQT